MLSATTHQTLAGRGAAKTNVVGDDILSDPGNPRDRYARAIATDMIYDAERLRAAAEAARPLGRSARRWLSLRTKGWRETLMAEML